MNKRSVLVFVVLTISMIATVGVIASFGSAGQENQKVQCERNCTQTYQDCLKAPNANQAQCKQAMDACTAACKDVPSKPTPPEEPTVTPVPSPTTTPTGTPMPTPTETPTPSPQA